MMLKKIFFLNFIIHLLYAHHYILPLPVIKDSKKVLDGFFFEEFYDNYRFQNYYKTCSAKDGPNCFQIDKYSYNNKFLRENLNKNITTLDKRLFYYANKVDDYLNKAYNNHNTKPMMHNPPKIPLKLFLTFQSFDKETIIGDIYMPKIKTVKYEFDQISFGVKGTLRLRYNKEKNNKGKEFPEGTYGIIESDELLFIFERPVTCMFFFIRQSSNKIKGKKNNNLSVETFLKGQQIFSYKINLGFFGGPSNWESIKLNSPPFDTIRFPGGFDIDNLYFIQMTDRQYQVDIHFEKKEKPYVNLVKEDLFKQ